MIKKFLVSVVLISGMAYASSNTVTSVGTLHQNTQPGVWTAALEQKKVGDTCDDGDCLSDLKLCQKGGPMHKLVTSVRDEIKRFCKKL